LTDILEYRILKDSISEVLNFERQHFDVLNFERQQSGFGILVLKVSSCWNFAMLDLLKYSIFEVLNFERQHFWNFAMLDLLEFWYLAKYRHCNLERLEIRQIFWSIEF
jgi:hypothetical protein